MHRYHSNTKWTGIQCLFCWIEVELAMSVSKVTLHRKSCTLVENKCSTLLILSWLWYKVHVHIKKCMITTTSQNLRTQTDDLKHPSENARKYKWSWPELERVTIRLWANKSTIEQRALILFYYVFLYSITSSFFANVMSPAAILSLNKMKTSNVLKMRNQNL